MKIDKTLTITLTEDEVDEAIALYLIEKAQGITADGSMDIEYRINMQTVPSMGFANPSRPVFKEARITYSSMDL